jgi:hypothetical protein
MDDRKVTLGTQELTVRPITLGVMKRLGMGAAKQRHAGANGMKREDDWAKAEGEWYDGTMEILSAGLGKTVAELEAIENVTFDQLNAANLRVLVVSGLATEPAKKPTTGEATGATG